MEDVQRKVEGHDGIDGEYIMPAARAMIEMGLGHTDRLIAELEACVADRTAPFTLLAMLGPDVWTFEGDERFRAVLEKLRLPSWV